MVRRCDSCEWWKRSGDEDFGECKNEPPKTFWSEDEKDWISLYPETRVADWCGQHKATDEDMGSGIVNAVKVGGNSTAAISA